MPKVKIVFMQPVDYNDYYSAKIIRDGLDWEEVSDEELTILRSHLHRIPSRNTYGLQPQLLVQDTVPIAERIRSAREIAQQLQHQEEQRKQKRQAAIKAGKERRRQQKLEMLRKLQEELGEAAPDDAK